MIMYRYELPDGGGPFCTYDGILRTAPEYKMCDDSFSGCETISDLEKWFSIRKININNFILAKYEGELLHKYSNGEILMKRSTSKPINV